DGDLHSKPAERSGHLELHVLEALGIHVARMRVEPGQHAVDRRFDELAVVDPLNVVRTHTLEDIAEQVELPVGVARCRSRTRSLEHEWGLYGDEGQGRTCRRAEKIERRFAHPQTSLAVTAPNE